MKRTAVANKFGALVATPVIALGVAVSPIAHADPVETPGPNIDSSMFLIDVTWTAYVTDPNTGKSSKDPVVARAQCSGWDVSNQDGSTYIVTAGHCADIEEGKKAVKDQALGDLADLYSDEEYANIPLFYRSDETGANIQVSRKVGVVRNDDINKDKFDDATPAEVIDVEPMNSGDLTLLRANLSGPATPLGISTDPITVGQPVTAVGYLGEADMQSADSAWSLMHITGTVLQTPAPKVPDNVFFTAVSTQTNHGMSGGPIIDKNGKVIGTDSYFLTKSAVPQYISDRSNLWRFLAKNQVVAPIVQPTLGAHAPIVLTHLQVSQLIWVVPVLVGGLVIFALFVVLALRLRQPVEPTSGGTSP